MGIQSGGKYFYLWFTLGDGRLCVRLVDQDDQNASGKATTERGRCPEWMNKLTTFRCDVTGAWFRRIPCSAVAWIEGQQKAALLLSADSLLLDFCTLR